MKKQALLAAIATTLALPGAATAATGLSFGDTVKLNSNGGANKTKIVRMTNGRLVSVYGDYLDPNENTVYDVKEQGERPARDIFARYCDADCDQESSWSEEVNLSNTAAKTSINTDWTGYTITIDETGEIISDTRDAKAFQGDSDKPNIFNSGSRVVVSWVDKYCEGGDQRMVSYRSLENREIPFSCTYAVTSSDNGTTWSDAVQLSSGERDAKQDVSRGLGTGEWALTWQEDPRGLQRGEAEGPGDGASGANTSHGTDIWYSYALKGWGTQDAGIWTTPVRVTDNYIDGQEAAGNFDVIKDSSGEDITASTGSTSVDGSEIVEGGKAGASRANLALQFGELDSTPQVILAYEETKGSDGLDEGKYVRYHTFDWNNPEAQAGCIISNPLLNARRVRFVPQKEAGPVSGMRLGIFWKEGEFTQGGPSDIMLRKGIVNGGNGFSPAEMVPAVDANCAVSDYASARALNNAPALNMSSQADVAQATTDADIANSTLSDDTNQVVEESANAHRGLLRGDDLYIGYTYTPVLAELLYTNTKNYNFYLRHYNGATGEWSAPENKSNETDTTINVREPRLVGTPGSTPACATNPEECQDKTKFYLAWGKQTNVSAWSDNATSELDLYATRVEDKGAYLTPIVTFAGEADGVETFESQIRMTPAGNRLFTVWNQIEGDETHAMYRESTVVELPDDVVETNEGDGTLVGCSYSPGAPFDPTLLLLTALAIGGLTVRNLKARS